ncbi:MAG TPA: hypothetical protein VFZ12_08055 [Dehalococcoidia bacterium]|nr:hypothetical protein [Dehalococcoidia bacterium]
MDLQDWRDLTFTVFGTLMIITLILMTVVAAVASYFMVKGLTIGRTKLAEARPTVTNVRQVAARVEAGASKTSDTVATPFIKLRGLMNAVKEGAMTLVRGRDEGP